MTTVYLNSMETALKIWSSSKITHKRGFERDVAEVTAHRPLTHNDELASVLAVSVSKHVPKMSQHTRRRDSSIDAALEPTRRIDSLETGC